MKTVFRGEIWYADLHDALGSEQQGLRPVLIIQTGFRVTQIPKTTWAVFRSEENDRIGVEILTLFTRAYSEWLPSSSYDKATDPAIEIYYTTPDDKHFEERKVRRGGLVFKELSNSPLNGNKRAVAKNPHTVMAFTREIQDKLSLGNA
jgi:hypothetical protein